MDLQDGVLILEADHGAWRQELTMLMPEIIEKFNALCGDGHGHGDPVAGPTADAAGSAAAGHMTDRARTTEDRTRTNGAEGAKEYTAQGIQVLKGLEAVRKRPAMYIGDTGLRGLHHLVYEVVDNSIDEAMAGYCDEIQRDHRRGRHHHASTDNGRGIPVDMHKTEGKPALEVVLTSLHAGGKFDKGSYKVSGGLHGVGVSCVNALSRVAQGRGAPRRQGLPHGVRRAARRVGRHASRSASARPTRRGTTITFKPDHEIFPELVYTYETLRGRLRELAFLNRGLSITIARRARREAARGDLPLTRAASSSTCAG